MRMIGTCKPYDGKISTCSFKRIYDTKTGTGRGIGIVSLDKILKKELEIHLETNVYWVDSQIGLWYLCSADKRFQTNVSNRIAKILTQLHNSGNMAY